MKNSSALLVLALISFCACSHKPQYPFQDTTLQIEERVNDLVSRLTLEEKVAQMCSSAPGIERLGIPAYDWQNECLHGVGKVGSYKVTVFPQPIGMAATWDEESIHSMANYTAEEGRAIYQESKRRGEFGSYHGLTYWAPNINIFRDPRWGRGHETFGEDPYLTAVLGMEFVRGLQGDDPHYLKASACVKHYAVHSGPEATRHEFNTEVSTYDLWDTYLPAFRDLVTEAGVTGIMCAYNAYAGRPCCGNDLLMMDILRNKWRFQGYVTSDCGAIDDFYKFHKTHADTISAAIDAVLHGTDLDCIRDITFKTLERAVQEKRIDEKEIDKAVKRLFSIRFKLGMFDPDDRVPYTRIPLSVLESEQHQKHALKMAQQSIVLLKNENHILPLSKDVSRIAVIGPNADARLDLLGNYHGYPSQVTSIVEAIQQKVSPKTKVYHEKMLDYLAVDNFQPCTNTEQYTFHGEPGIYAEYFNNPDFSGDSFTRKQTCIDIHYMGITNLFDRINSERFSARYTTVFTPLETGEYMLNLDTDKRFRLSVNNAVCIDALQGKAKAEGKYTMLMEKGKPYQIKLEIVMKGRHGNLSFRIGKRYSPSMKELASRVKDADIIVFVGGISPALEGEQNGVSCVGFQDGDRTTIALPEVQTAFMKELQNTGKPVVFVMLTGSAIAIPWEAEHIPAILNAWYGGQSGGTAVSDVLFGDYNPAGRLPVTFYKSDKDLPPFTDYSMEGRTYRYFKKQPLYPFGHGLSYTTFDYKNLSIKEKSSTTDSISVKVDITNSGDRDGEEVSQLYLTHLDKESYLPLRTLKGFKRIFLKTGETKTITFILSPKDLAVNNDFGELTVQPGSVRISVGGGQPGQSNRLEVLEKTVVLKGNNNKIN